MASRSNYDLKCEWLSDEETNETCQESFSNFTDLYSHVNSQHLSSYQSPPFICRWSSCHYSSHEHSHYKRHVLYHPYHSMLKQKGLEYQLTRKLPSCQLTDDIIGNPLLSLDGFDWICKWVCDGSICNRNFDNVLFYYTHVREHIQLQKGPKKCHWLDCMFEANTSSNLADHVRTHTQEKVISCPSCGILFCSNAKYQDHLQRQAPPTDSTHTCYICKKCFSTERLLKEHIRKHVNTQKCPHCAMTCTSQSALLYHMTYRHSDCRPHQCPLCQKKFKTEYSLSEHLETHGKKSFSCSETGCNYSGKSLKGLQRHVRIEHNEYICYCCHICDLKYKQGFHLTNHLKKIHGFTLPPGHSRFRYILCEDGCRRLQTVRLDKDDIAQPLPTTT